MVTDSETEKKQTLKNQGRQIKYERIGYESTTKKRRPSSTSYQKKQNRRIKKKRIPIRGRVQMTQAERTRTIKYVLAESSRWLLHRQRDTKKINIP